VHITRPSQPLPQPKWVYEPMWISTCFLARLDGDRIVTVIARKNHISISRAPEWKVIDSDGMHVIEGMFRLERLGP
jgi:hypothetical protein